MEYTFTANPVESSGRRAGVTISRIIAACGILFCAAAAARGQEIPKIFIGTISVEGLEKKAASSVRARILEEISALGVSIASSRKAADGILDLRVLRSGDMVRITMRFFNRKGTKVLEIKTTESAEEFPALVSLRRDLRRGLEALGLSMPGPVVEEAPGIEAVYSEPETKAPPPAAVKTVVTPLERKPGTFTWGWVVAGVGGALLAGGAVTGSMALSLNEDLTKKCPDGVCEPGHQDEIDRLESLGYATDILLSVGAATAVAGVILLLFYEGDEGDLSIGPVVGAGFSGAVVQGRF
jgi:hypothetical protein